MSNRAAFYVSVDGSDISGVLDPYLTSISITDASGSTSDAAEIELDDAGGQIELPPTGAKISIGLGWEGEGTMVSFDGMVDSISSKGARGGGRTLTISAKSADQKGKGKHRHQKHKDKAKLKDVASEWGKASGLDGVHVDESLGDTERDYWSMAGESFEEWGVRIAADLGATFKIMGSQAVMVPRNAGKSASGKPLPTIHATCPGNVIQWSMSPTRDKHRWKKVDVAWYDQKEAKHKRETVEVEGDDGEGSAPEATHLHRWRGADKDSAQRRAKSTKAAADREKGSGSVTIDGEPSAQAEALCILSGSRPGIDGTYRIDTVKHGYTRSGGFTTELTLKQPQGDAGKDKRRKTKK